MRPESEVLDHYALPLQGATCTVAGGGFSGAVVVRVSSSAGDFCLRGWPEPGMPEARVAELHRFCEFLHHRGLDFVPVPVRSRSGATLTRHRGRLWQVEPWMPGAGDFHAAPTDARLLAAVEALATVHRVAGDYQPTPAGRTWFYSASAPSPAVSERLALLREWTPKRREAALRWLDRAASAPLQEALRRTVVAAGPRIGSVRGELESLCTVRFALQPTLRDVWHDHLLFSGDRLTGLVDWGATRTEHPAADLSRLLGSLLGVDRERWQQALDAYGALRPLDDTERGLVTALDHSGVLLSGLSWCARIVEQEEAVGESDRVADRLRGIATRIEQLPPARPF